MNDVFLSYSRADLEVAKSVYSYLLSNNLEVWIDEAGILPGDPSWKVAVETAIKQSKCLVVILTPNAANSRWVRAELDYAEAQNLKIFFVLESGDASNAVPFGYTAAQWIDIRNKSDFEHGLEKLLANIRLHLEATDKHLSDGIRQKLDNRYSKSIRRSNLQPSPSKRSTPGMFTGLGLWNCFGYGFGSRAYKVKIKAVEFTFFGPSGCGKTSLIRAFCAVFERSLANSNFIPFISIDDQYLDSQMFMEPPGPTQDLKIRELVIRRIPKNEHDRFQRMSSFEHHILLHTNWGRYVEHTTDHRVTNLQSFHHFYPDAYEFWRNLEASQCIFVLLDPTRIQKTNLYSPLSYSEITGDEYALMVTRLNWLNETGQKIIICITKCDTIGDRYKLDTDRVIDYIFGREMLLAVNSLKAKFGEKNVKVCMTSAFGFTSSGTPNYNETSRWILDKDDWEPFQVTEPFFWTLEQLETDYIHENVSQYPSVLKRLTGYLRWERRDALNYIPYNID